MINIDQTLIIQFVLFVTFMLLLNQVLFKPFIRLLEERQRRIFGTKEEAEHLRTEAERLMEAYEGELRKRREEAFRAKGSLRDEAKKEANSLIEKVQEEAQRELAKAKERIGREAEEALRELKGRADILAKEMAQKVLGRPLA